jgi:hypothetical protein
MKKSVKIAKPIAQKYENMEYIKTDVSAKPTFEVVKDSITGLKMYVVTYPSKIKTDEGFGSRVFIDAETMEPFVVGNGTGMYNDINKELRIKLTNLVSQYSEIHKKARAKKWQEKEIFINKLIEKKARPVAMEYGKVDGKAPKITGIENSFLIIPE